MQELINGFDASIKEWKAAKVGPAGIDIAFHRFGQPDPQARRPGECDALFARGVMPTGGSR
jgi:hypothetical protein